MWIVLGKEEQVSIIVTILATLLTGGFLMIFIESQQVANNMAECFHFIMHPFLHSFTSYARFISSFKTCFSFRGIEAEGYMKRLKDDIEQISKIGGKSIIAGQEYPSDYFTAKQLDSICNTINDVWYCIDKDYHSFQKIEFDTRHAEMFGEDIISYLVEISPKYNGVKLTKDLLGKVSEDFYVDFYQPIEHILPEYECWLKKEKEFKILAMATIIITLLTMLVLLLLRCYIPIWVLTLLCVLCCGLLLFELYRLMGLEDLTKNFMR